MFTAVGGPHREPCTGIIFVRRIANLGGHRPPWHGLQLRPEGERGRLRLTINFLTISA